MKYISDERALEINPNLGQGYINKEILTLAEILNRRILKHRQTRESAKKFARHIKAKTGCALCGERRWWVLDFHHKDPKSKRSCVSNLTANRSILTISEEIAKCEVLCSNCHRDTEYRKRNGRKQKDRQNIREN